MEQSILKSTKKILGIDAEYDAFDLDIMTHINTVFTILSQLGVGPVGGYMIEDDEATWDEILGADIDLNSIKTYVYLRVRILFDPPNTPHLINALEEQRKELEYRISQHREVTHWVDPEPDPEDPIFDLPVIDAGTV